MWVVSSWNVNSISAFSELEESVDLIFRQRERYQVIHSTMIFYFFNELNKFLRLLFLAFREKVLWCLIRKDKEEHECLKGDGYLRK